VLASATQPLSRTLSPACALVVLLLVIGAVLATSVGPFVFAIVLPVAALRISLFRRQRFIPWRTIRLDRVPHPTVFTKLITQCAPKTEIDDSFATLAN
jgi:hypothetical protein